MEPGTRPAERSIALVTGAAQGIGRGIAQSLAEASYRVVMADIDDGLLEKATTELATCGFDVLAQHLEVGSERDWASAIAFAKRRMGRT